MLYLLNRLSCRDETLQGDARLLRNQGLSTDQLNTAFVGLIVSRLLYALPAWGVLVSAGQACRIDAFLKRAHKWGFCKDVVTFNELLIKSGSSLFQKMQSPVHCHNSLLPPIKKTDYTSLETGTVITYYRNVILMFLSIHLSIGVFLSCDFFMCHCHCIVMHVCCVIFNKLSISVSHVTLQPIKKIEN